MRIGDMRRWSAGKVSHTVFYILLTVIALMFGLFYLVGYDRPYEDNPEYNAPLLSGALVGFTLLFTAATVVVCVTALCVGMRRRENGGTIMNGIRSNRVASAVLAATSLILAVAFALGSSSPLIVNGQTYQSAFWLKAADMFVYSIAIMLILSVAAVAYGIIRGKYRS